jgi:hypothetical protein
VPYFYNDSFFQYFQNLSSMPFKSLVILSWRKKQIKFLFGFYREGRNVYRIAGIERLKNKVQGNEYGIFSPIPENIKAATWRLATDIEIKKGNLESHLHAIERVHPNC